MVKTLIARMSGDNVIVVAGNPKGEECLVSLAQDYGGAEVDFVCRKCKGDVVNNPERYRGINKLCKCSDPSVKMEISHFLY